MRNEVIERALAWANGATIHDVNCLIALWRCGEASWGRDELPLRWRHYGLRLMAAANGTLADFVRHGDYRRARADNPLPPDPPYDPF